MFNIIPVLETIAPIVGGIAGIVSSVSSSSSSSNSSSAPVVVEKPKCEVVETPQYPQVQMPNITFNLNLYFNGEKLGGCQSIEDISIDTEIE